MGKHKLQRNSARWNTLASAYFGGDIHRLKCTDADLARPDQIKFQYCTYITDFEPGKSKADRMERDAERGPLHEIPDIRHWALEEYFWHGVPGDDWDPLEAYLEFVGERLSETGKAQLRQWKQARVGAFRIGSVQGDSMLLEEWDTEQRVVIGEPFRVISLGMGGVQPFRDLRGDIHIGYIAPWKPAENLYCSMGYCVMPKIKEAEAFELLLNLHLPALVVTPLPWKTTSVAQQRYLREWYQRDWNAWLADRLQFPFRALTAHPITKKLVPVKLTALLYSNPGVGRDLGVYMAMSGLLGFAVTGVANVLPVDLASPNWMPIAEYREYRRLVGAPPKAPGGTFKTIWIDR
ncbi:MAG: hypothetical protein HZB51_06320 [Chloroflexi bacterium]|nr:hypothetical protein [Chloroflexota bacterium]